MRCPNCHHDVNDGVPRITLEAAEADAKRWRGLYDVRSEALADVERQLAQIKEYVGWACGSDSGTSSLTILSIITGIEFADGRRSTPRDDGDFGRCVRLLEAFPELREDLGAVPLSMPEWAPIVKRWADIEALYDAGLPAAVCAILRAVAP